MSTKASRIHTRMGIRDLGITVSLFDSNEQDHLAHIDNIGLGGISIFSDSKFSKEDKILISLNKAKNHYIRGVVRWATFDKDQQKVKYGLEFLAKNEDEFVVIEDFVVTMLNMLSKEKVVAKTLELFRASIVNRKYTQKQSFDFKNLFQIFKKA